MDEEPLVRAMPRRPLYALRGFIPRIDLNVLHAIDEEGWFATRTAIAADVDCKEVRVAVVVVRRQQQGPEVLIGTDDRLAHGADIGPESEGLAALKAIAKATAEQVSGGLAHGVELAGYLNEDAEPELRHAFILVYRARVPPDTVAPEGLRWLSRSGLPRSLDPLSARVLDAIV
jgi:hypothetical protein